MFRVRKILFGRQESQSATTRRPRRFQYQVTILRQKLPNLFFSPTFERFADGALHPQLRQQRASRPAVRKQTNGLQLFIRRQLFCTQPTSHQLGSQGAVPAPGLDAVLLSRAEREFGRGELRVCSDQDVIAQQGVSPMAELLPCITRLVNVVNHHDISHFCPNSRQKTKVVTQLTPGVRSCEVRESTGQRNVVFRVEYVKSHTLFARKDTKKV